MSDIRENSHPKSGDGVQTILVVDDSPMSLKLLAQIMTVQGYRVITAASGDEALAVVNDALPDLILLDVMMPGLNGFEVAARLHSDARTKEIPVIFVSAVNDGDKKVSAFSAGGVDYVSKPIHIQEVVARVETHLRLRETTQRLRQQLIEREQLIANLDTVNAHLKREMQEREAAQEAREASLKLLRQALDKAEALFRIARSLVTSEDIPDMLQTVTESVTVALHADRVVIRILDVDARAVTSIATGGHGFRDADPAVPIFFEGATYEELMEGLTGWVVQHTQPVISPKDHPDPRESVAARRRREATKCGAVMMVPLYYQGRMMGTIAAINRPDQPDFKAADLAQLSAIAGQLSVALANARLSVETAYLKEFNEGIVQGVAEAILLIDGQQQCITYANPAATVMLGYDLAALTGRWYGEFLPEIRCNGEGRSVGNPGVATRLETVIHQRDATSVPVLASTRPLFQEGQLTGCLVVLTDITEIKAAEAQLRQYASDLEAQNAELDAFAHTVAHDLRSPLTGILGFVDLLQSTVADEGSPEVLEYIHYLYRNSAKMNNIIDELLLLSSVRERDDVEIRPLDMGRIVEEAQNRLDYLIDEHKAIVLSPSQWPQVRGYPQWIEEVWVNYLSNAVKYGGRPDAGIAPRIELGFDYPSDADDQVRFWVRDNGLGLTADQRSQLFTPFERLHNVRAEGHGLGLSIVRRILEKLRGTVGVESTLGEGSTFYFVLPRD